jgi:hypothetical protein
MFKLKFKYAVVLICILLLSQLCYAQSPTSATLQTAASSGNGTALDVTGYSGLTLSILGTAGSDRVVTFQASSDGTNYSSISCTNVSTLALSTTVTTSGTTLVQARCNVVGFRLFRAVLSGGTTGTVTITALGLAQVTVVYPPTTGAGSGDALVADPLSQFAPTTSAQLAATISDETGTGFVVFGTTPSFTTSAILGSGDNTATIGAFTLRGPAAVGTDLNGAAITLTTPTGTGAGTLSRFIINGVPSKQVAGSTAHATAAYLTIGANQASHPGTAGFITSAPAVTVTDEVTAGSATAALASAHSFLGKTFGARNTLVTTTDVTTLYVTPSAGGTNNTATNAYSAIFTGAIRADGVVKMPGLASSSAATTGTLCWTTGTGNINVDTTTTCLLSTLRVKHHIHALNSGMSIIKKLRPVSYELKPQYDHDKLGVQIGLIAEEVVRVDKRLVSLDKQKLPLAVRYQQLTAVLVKALQEQQDQINQLEARLAKLENR